MARRIIRWTMNARWAVAFGLALCAACGPNRFRDVESASEVEPGERLLIGEVRVEGSDLSQWVRGLYLGTDVLMSHEIPQAFNHPWAVTLSTGEGVGDDTLTRTGGWFATAAPRSSVFVLGVRVWGNLVIGTTRLYFLPLVVESEGPRCAYIGTVKARFEGELAVLELADEFDQFEERGGDKVAPGCTVEKHLARYAPGVRTQGVEGVQAPPSGPPQIAPVKLRETRGTYPVRGKTRAELRHTLMQRGYLALGQKAEALTKAGIGVQFLCRQFTDGFRLTKALVHLDITITLPTWDPPAGVSEELRSAWKELIAAFDKHEVGHREIAHAHAERLREALTQLGPADSCAALEKAINEELDRVRTGHDAEQAEYDKRTRHGQTQGVVF